MKNDTKKSEVESRKLSLKKENPAAPQGAHGPQGWLGACRPEVLCPDP